MLSQDLITYALGIVALLNVGVAVWMSIKKPQEESKIFDEVFKEKFGTLEKSLTNLKDNHIHTLENKIDDTNKRVGEVEKGMVRIETILQERLPKK